MWTLARDDTALTTDMLESAYKHATHASRTPTRRTARLRVRESAGTERGNTMSTTTREMHGLVGRTYVAILSSSSNGMRGLRVTVYVLDVRTRYGTVDCLVTPLENMHNGTMQDVDNCLWMAHDRLF